MSNVNKVSVIADYAEEPARFAPDGYHDSRSATRNDRLRLVPVTKTPDYWQTESRSEALERAIARTG